MKKDETPQDENLVHTRDPYGNETAGRAAVAS